MRLAALLFIWHLFDHLAFIWSSGIYLIIWHLFDHLAFVWSSGIYLIAALQYCTNMHRFMKIVCSTIWYCFIFSEPAFVLQHMVHWVAWKAFLSSVHFPISQTTMGQHLCIMAAKEMPKSNWIPQEWKWSTFSWAMGPKCLRPTRRGGNQYTGLLHQVSSLAQLPSFDFCVAFIMALYCVNVVILRLTITTYDERQRDLVLLW